ncbi:MAG TPA: phospholipase D-like domain-containing protein [Candidatus Limnocylindrales bacterium]|nr:phospholipase D-like domain-containing protein [Candidatus Limnocylindrales bacterium]
MDWLEHISRFWPHLAAGFDFLASLLASVHALLHKRDSRAATLWLGVIWLMPVFGPLLYLALGVNRIRRRALQLGVHKTLTRPVPENLGEAEHEGAEHLKMLARVVNSVVTRPLLPGNQIQPLVNGDEAFPAMLAAIESAQKTISLSTYIFDNDPAGKKFVEALAGAVKRHVEVRVLIDAAGTRYSWPPVTRRLHRAKIPFARFLPASLLTPWRVATINLRNHRKILIVDGKTAFTGGMNIRQGNILGTRGGEATDEPGLANPKKMTAREDARPAKNAVQDLQFRVEGPVVTQLQEAFVNDWAFCTREILKGSEWLPELADADGVIARVITDGPDADFEKARLTLLAALTEAQTSIQIVTPYFLPDPALITALNLAALRGVRVDIVLPGKNNLPFVHWASRALWWQVLEHGCHIWLTPPPFDHSKLMIVDGHWVLFGSANWDARSLRLNFELNVECYGREFAQRMKLVFEQKLRRAREVTLAEADGRPLLPKLRDAVARLFSPYL